MSSIEWRVREQARKDAAEREARRRITEVSEINFPSLSSTEWGGGGASTSSSSTKKWAAAHSTTASSSSVGGGGEVASPEKTSRTSSTYIPPVIVSRASIAKAISTYNCNGGSVHEPKSEPEPEYETTTTRQTDDEWVEVRGKSSYSSSKIKTGRDDDFRDYEYNHYADDYFEDADAMGDDDRKNS